MPLMGQTDFITRSQQWLAKMLTNHTSFTAYLEPLVQAVLPQWRSDRLRSAIVQVRIESDDMYTLVIKPHRHWQGFEAGQYVELTVEKDGSWMSRFFSISSSPAYFKQTGLIELSIRIQADGRITPWLPKALQAGSIVNLGQALGTFCLNQSKSASLMIAGGSGITPFRAMLQQIKLQSRQHNIANSQIQHPITLLYFARSEQHFLFAQELQTIGQIPNIHVHFIDSSAQGFLSEQILDQYCADFTQRDIYLCGPSAMITHGKNLLSDLFVTPAQLHYEFFGPEPMEMDSIEGSQHILFSHSNRQISVSGQQPRSLLEIAEQENLNPVSGCRIGVCHQCICQKKSGVVYNTKTKTYSDTGQEEIQMCISVPSSDLVLEL